MHSTEFYLAAIGIFTALLWLPYILNRLIEWGISDFLKNYSDNFPNSLQSNTPWAQRAQRAHMNLVETLPAFIAVIVAASLKQTANTIEITCLAAVFFYARVLHAIVYISGVPYIRTPIYLVSWFAIIAIGFNTLIQ